MSMKNYQEMLAAKEQKYGLPSGLLLAMADTESAGNPDAVSRKGARGLLQLMPSTASDMGVEDIDDPEQNAEGGARYMRLMLDKHDGDIPTALAAYNAGPKAVAKHGGIPPYPETEGYIQKVTGKMSSVNDELPEGLSWDAPSQESASDNSELPEGLSWDAPNGQQQEEPTQQPEASTAETAQQEVRTVAPETTAQKVLGKLGAFEAVPAMASAVPAALGGGLAYLGALGASGGDLGVAEDTRQGVQNALTYQPASDQGQNAMQSIGEGMGALGNVINAPASAIRGLGVAAQEGSIEAGKKAYQQGQQEGLGENLGLGLSGAAKALGAPEEVQALAYAEGKTLPEAAMWLAPYAPKALKGAAKAERVIPQTEKADALIGRIIQGKKEDIPAARRALSQVDIKDVKGPADIAMRLDDKIKMTAKAVDDLVSKDTTKYKLSDLKNTTKVGNAVVYENSVQKAITQLSDLYRKTDNPVAEAAIKQLYSKSKKEGLTVKELNDLAREHGRELNAFGPEGKTPTGITKQSLENVRSGLKKTARGLVNDPAYAALDRSMSDMIGTRKKFQKLDERANAIRQRAVDQGVGAKALDAVIGGFDMATGGAVKSIPRQLFKNAKTSYNAAELADLTGKNLNKLEKIINAKDMTTAQKEAAIRALQQTPAAMETK